MNEHHAAALDEWDGIEGEPASAGRPCSHNTNTSARPWRQSISCGEATGPLYPVLAYAQYHAKIGSRRPSIPTPFAPRIPPGRKRPTLSRPAKRLGEAGP